MEMVCGAVMIYGWIAIIIEAALPNFAPINADDIHFYYHPPPSSAIPANENGVIPATVLDPLLSTVILVHGWREDGRLPWIRQLAHLYHARAPCNVLSLDWSAHARLSYFRAAGAVPLVGKMAGDRLAALVLDNGLDVARTHLIGHSLGAHVAGVMGQRVHKRGLGKVGRITGLDPAGPLFEYPLPKRMQVRLNKGDAEFVDFVHTDVGMQGEYFSYGDVDFYINNGGPFQPGCNASITSLWNSTTCSHKGSRVYFAKAMLRPWDFIGVKCKNRLAYGLKRCSFNETAVMGEFVSRNASGNFYLDTNVTAIDPNM